MKITLDVETYYDKAYSLKKMPTYQYIRDSRFHIHGWSVKPDGQPCIWMNHSDFTYYLKSLPSDGVEMIMHNAYFDAFVLYQHYNYTPELIIDTLSMARALLPYLPSHSLDNLAKHLGLGAKIEGVLPNLEGVRQLTPEQFDSLGIYANNDAQLTYELYQKLAPALPKDEFLLIDETIRWGANPVLEVDTERAAKALKQAEDHRNNLISASGTKLEVLSSQQKFTAYLEEQGVTVPLKKNSKGKLIPALGKSDQGFQQLYIDYPHLSHVLKAREAAKSTSELTRTRRILELGQIGTMPMPLNHCGARTKRWSGADLLNVQNFVRGSELRKSIIAPKGYVILVGDLSQIELRMNFWFCGQQDYLQAFIDGADIYKLSAAKHYGVPINDVTDDQRFFAKQIELGLGYGAGWRKFRMMCAQVGIILSKEEAYATVAAYRRSHYKIPQMWRQLDNLINHMYRKDCHIELDPLIFRHEAVYLPSGLWLDYTGLEPTERGWQYGLQRISTLYGAKVLENGIQALARIPVGNMILDARAAGIKVVSTTHDEIISIVPESEADHWQQVLYGIMTTAKDWYADLPLEAELGYAREYSK